MFVCCVSSFSEIGRPAPDLILFPEYTKPGEIKSAAREFPASIVIGAIREGIQSRGLVLHRGCNRIDYLKVNSDGTTRGTGVLPPLPVYETGNLAVGVIICMDVQIPELVRNVVGQLASSTSEYKIVCIPAHMGSGWFSGPEVDANLANVFVALCNHTDQDRPRCKSFITKPDRQKSYVQTNTEMLLAELQITQF